ncbi:DNA polymerase III subunit delta' [Paracrocinitomix mangrovi]|uniref:DNA polymerase III subunit delta' n=1 Tax=Paracrocinitomix mangrovi TaxID=2862509 RepID=UPI001C8D6A5A|nr:DNA polymerase III subunit delta' [Paracrocinitomix mangrovi]UKN00502.1 DNA polymerase III subunit delta' [Paracrocinitomix mangrovi]
MLFKDVIGHSKTKQHLINEVKADRVSHAQMLLGPPGIGKLPLAIAFAQYLLCDNPSAKDSCGICPNCQKMQSLTHPDLHFVYPVVVSKTDKIASSDDARTEWNKLLTSRPYFDLNGWMEYIGFEGKNPIIGVEESRAILKKLSLKSFSGKYKIMIVWLPEKMNSQAANKLLKILEEPPTKTLFFLVCDSSEEILPTIISRCQIIRIPQLSPDEISAYLEDKHKLDKSLAQTFANLSQGNLVNAINTAQGDEAHNAYFDLFVKLMRAAYAANPNELMDVSDEIAALDKEKQKNFVLYGLHIFRESLIKNYLNGELLNLREEEERFLDKFARFINNQNITELMTSFNDAYYHIERNANAKILFSDLVISLTKLIRKGV